MGARMRRVLLAGCFALSAGVYVFGIDETFVYGHSGWCASRRAVAGRNFVEHGFVAAGFGPVENLGRTEPDEFQHYWHHPVGIHLLVGASFSVLGVGEWQARVVPVLLMLASFLLFYLLARQWWRGPGLWAALVLLPTIPMLGYYGPFVNQEPLVLLACLAATWSWQRWTATGQRRWIASAGAVAVLGAWSDWPWLVYAFGLACVATLSALKRRRVADLGWLVVFCAGVLIGLAVVLNHLLSLQDVKDPLQAFEKLAEFRGGGEKKTLSQVVEKSGPKWIELFTPGLLAAGIAWAAVSVWDLVRGRVGLRHGVAWVSLATGAIWVYVFRQGATIHEYWPFFAAPYFVIAGADVVERGAGLLRRALGTWLRPPAAARATAAVALLLVLAQATAGLAGISKRHRQPDTNNMMADGAWRHRHAVLGTWLSDHTAPDDRIAFHDDVLKAKFQLGFYCDRRRSWHKIRSSDRRFTVSARHALAVADLRALPAQSSDAVVTDLVSRYPVTVVDDFLIARTRPEKGDKTPKAQQKRDRKTEKKRKAESQHESVRWWRSEPREPGLLFGWLESVVYQPSELVRDPLLEAWLLLYTGHTDAAVTRYAAVDTMPDDFRHRVADHNLARAAGLTPPDPATWLGTAADAARQHEATHKDADGPRLGDAATVLGWTLREQFRFGQVFEAVLRVDEPPGKGWRPFFDRYGTETKTADPRRPKRSLKPRVHPDPHDWRAGDLVWVRTFVPLHPWHEDVSIRFGFWRHPKRAKGKPAKKGNDHLKVGHADGLSMPLLDARPQARWPWYLRWMDLRWYHRDHKGE